MILSCWFCIDDIDFVIRVNIESICLKKLPRHHIINTLAFEKRIF